MNHTWFECHCNQPGCMFCDGGLGACKVCNGMEGDLTAECCGRPITKLESHFIYNEGTLDFANGKWQVKKPYEYFIKSAIGNGSYRKILSEVSKRSYLNGNNNRHR